MSNSNGPALAAILITPDRFDTIRKSTRHLRAQAAHERIELVIVAPALEGLQLDDAEVSGFHSVQVVELGEISSGGGAIAAGYRRASAPLVVYVEEHSYPAPGWAEALIEAHRGPWAAVGEAVLNANPDSATSWAGLFLEFGAWVPPAVAGEARLLASHQTCYKRDLLLDYGDALDELLETESTLQQDLLSKGHRLFFEPAARTQHVNVSSVAGLIDIQFENYRVFGANRAAHGRWPIWRRLLYVLCGPLLPAVRLFRILREVGRCGRSGELLPRILPPLLLGVAMGGVGEVAGYLFGPGKAAENRLTFELERLRHVTEMDRQDLMAG